MVAEREEHEHRAKWELGRLFEESLSAPDEKGRSDWILELLPRSGLETRAILRRRRRDGSEFRLEVVDYDPPPVDVGSSEEEMTPVGSGASAANRDTRNTLEAPAQVRAAGNSQSPGNRWQEWDRLWRQAGATGRIKDSLRRALAAQPAGLTHADILALARGVVPDLCREDVPCIHRQDRSLTPEYDHRVRSAEQGERLAGRIELDSSTGRWRIMQAQGRPGLVRTGH